MKYLVVLALCATAALAEITLDRKTLEKHRDECASQYHIKDLESMAEMEKTCFFECYGKKIGMIKQDGTYDIEGLLVQAKPEAKEEARKNVDLVFKTCTDRAGNDPCKMATCFVSVTGP